MKESWNKEDELYCVGKILSGDGVLTNTLPGELFDRQLFTLYMSALRLYETGGDVSLHDVLSTLPVADDYLAIANESVTYYQNAKPSAPEALEDGIGKRIKINARLRGIKTRISKISNEGWSAYGTRELMYELNGLIEMAESVTSHIYDSSTSTVSESIDSAITEHMVRRDAVVRGANYHMRFGIEAMDKLLPEGIVPGQYGVIAASTGGGKTFSAMQIALGLAGRGSNVLYFSTEMTERDMANRYLAVMSDVGYCDLLFGTSTEEGKQKLNECRDRVANHALQFYCKHDATTLDISIAVEQYKSRANVYPDVVFIDYLQNLNPNPKMVSSRPSIEERMSAISRAIRLYAISKNIAVIVLSQLNREGTKRKAGEPQLSDLRGSGQIEHDSHWVLFIYKDEHEVEQLMAGGASYGAVPYMLRVAKHRNIGNVNNKAELPVPHLIRF